MINFKKICIRGNSKPTKITVMCMKKISQEDCSLQLSKGIFADRLGMGFLINSLKDSMILLGPTCFN